MLLLILRVFSCSFLLLFPLMQVYTWPFSEILCVSEQFLLFHCPVLPYSEMHILGQIAAHCWEQVASEEDIVLQFAIIFSSSICWGISCTLQLLRQGRQSDLWQFPFWFLTMLLLFLVFLACSPKDLGWIAQRLLKMLVLGQFTTLFLNSRNSWPFQHPCSIVRWS